MKQKFNIGGMSCSACSSAVERAVKRLPGVTEAEVNLLSSSMLCEFDGKLTSVSSIISAVEKAGFTAEETGRKNTSKNAAPAFSDNGTNEKTRLIISVCFLVPLMYVAMGHMLSLPLCDYFSKPENSVNFGLTQLLLVLPIVYVNRKFYAVGTKALLHRSPNMDTLVAVGSLSALLYGVFSVYMMGYGLGHAKPEVVSRYMSNLYFESAGMILTLVTLGKFFEKRSLDKTNSVLKKLLDLTPQTVTVIRNGVSSTVPADELVIDDIIEIKPGERVPVDGIITEGASSLDLSALTGESLPQDKKRSDSVMSASVNLSGSFRMRATAVGSETTLARIISLVETAGASKAPVAKLADRISAFFVPAVITVALISAAAWLAAGYGFEFSLGIGISVLVVSCPCALGLATPVAITVAMGRSAAGGVLVKNAEALQRLHSADTVVFDKTGTLTAGNPSVTDVIALTDELPVIAVSLERLSEHPLSLAVSQHFREIIPQTAENFSAVFGKGVMADVSGVRCYGGSKAFMTELGISTVKLDTQADLFSKSGKTPLYFSKEKELLGVIAVADTVKTTSKKAISELHSLKIDVIMLTGDNKTTADAIARDLGIETVIADVLPEDKEKAVSSLRSGGRTVVMVGDGINDSPALCAADVGVSLSGGVVIAIDAADIVLMKNDLSDICREIKYSRTVMRNIRQNLFWAFFYNTVGIPIAAGVLYLPFGILLSPMIAAAAMSLSSVFVVTNALRLYKLR